MREQILSQAEMKGLNRGNLSCEHFTHARLTNEDDENENGWDDVEYVDEQGTYVTGIRQDSYNFGCPGNAHQQKETQDHFEPAIWVTHLR